MSAKRTSWNEFSSAMASAMICLSTGEQGNADTTVEEPETTVLEDATNDQPIPSPTPLTPPPQQPQDVPSTSHAQSPLLQPHCPTPAQIQGAHFPMSLLQEALDVCATLARRVVHLEQDKRVDTFDDTLIEDVSNQGRVISRDEDDVKETEEVKEYTADTQVEKRQADIYHIDMDHAAKLLKVVAVVSEAVSAAAVLPFAVPEIVSAVAAIPTVTAPPVNAAALVKADLPSTKQKR
nr:hypothetical protein [Tanacetum cinerariifolium]